MNMEESPLNFNFLYPLVSKCVACDSITVKKFQSSQTGITVVTADVPGPLVHGFFVVGKPILIT